MALKKVVLVMSYDIKMSIYYLRGALCTFDFTLIISCYENCFYLNLFKTLYLVA